MMTWCVYAFRITVTWYGKSTVHGRIPFIKEPVMQTLDIVVFHMNKQYIKQSYFPRFNTFDDKDTKSALFIDLNLFYMTRCLW